MPSGIYADVAVGDPMACQVAPHSDGDWTVTSVARTSHPDEAHTVIEEFTVTETDRMTSDGGHPVADGVDELFESDGRQVFRFERETPQHCLCERIERNGCPVRNVEAIDGTLHVAFVAPEQSTLQSVLGCLTDAYDDLSVRRLLRSTDSDDSDRLRLVNVDELTRRQHEALSTAHKMGYFEYPKEASAAEVADAIDIAPSTFTEHLAAAQRNLLGELLDR